MRIPLTILLISLCTARLWGGPITIEESSVDRGATIYREKRWFRGGEKIMAESWILEKGTSEPKIHAQMIFVGDISVIAFSRIKELVAVTKQGCP